MTKKSWPINTNEEHGCMFYLLSALAVIGIGIFLGPWVVMHAWNLIAVGMFGAPAMGYWTAFWGTLAVHCLIPSSLARNLKND